MTHIHLLYPKQSLYWVISPARESKPERKEKRRVWNHIIISVRKGIFLTRTAPLCILAKAHRTSRFRVAPERALGIHALKAGSTVMALLHTLIDVWRR